MNDFGLSAILGVIEGLTEFLPVSSTAHLRIAEALLGIDLSDGYWKMFSIVIQLGAILCLPIYFRGRIAEMIGTFPRGRRGDRTVSTHPLTLTFVAFLCTAIPAFLLTKIIGKHLENLPLMACSLIAGGALMWVVDAMYGQRGSATIDDITPGQAIWIGLCQTLSAVFPGLSRSMSTITAGEVAGLPRTTALEFSFLLSMPTMAAATGYDLLKSLRGHGDASVWGAAGASTHAIVVLLIGSAVSFVVAWASVAWLMHLVRRHGFTAFAVYRIVVGTAVLIWALGRA